jgi:hypothetical protein
LPYEAENFTRFIACSRSCHCLCETSPHSPCTAAALPRPHTEGSRSPIASTPRISPSLRGKGYSSLFALCVAKTPEFSYWNAYLRQMNRRMFAVSFIVACLLVCRTTAATQEKQPIVVVSGPTVIAFFDPAPKAGSQQDPDANEAFSDFRVYAAQVRGPFSSRGIKFYELYTRSFRLSVGKRLSTIQADKAGAGYCLIAPGKKPQIQSGVMTDTDLLQTANDYFSNAAK